MLSAAQRLRRRSEFAAVVRAGRRSARGVLVIHVLRASDGGAGAVNGAVDRGPDGSVRVGFVVGRAVGQAVTRNLVKRRLRHLVKQHVTALPAGGLVVVRALPGAASRTYQQLGSDFRAALTAAGMPVGEAVG